MPLVFQKETPDYRYMIFVKESGGRYVVMLIQGVCTMAECRSFASVYPVHFITPAEAYKIPDAEVHFQHEVTSNVSGFSVAYPGQSTPDWLIYFAEHFGQLRFIDAYTFHVSKHLCFAIAHGFD